jgi:hypothetical protein
METGAEILLVERKRSKVGTWEKNMKAGRQKQVATIGMKSSHCSYSRYFFNTIIEVLADPSKPTTAKRKETYSS